MDDVQIVALERAAGDFGPALEIRVETQEDLERAAGWLRSASWACVRPAARRAIRIPESARANSLACATQRTTITVRPDRSTIGTSTVASAEHSRHSFIWPPPRELALPWTHPRELALP